MRIEIVVNSNADHKQFKRPVAARATNVNPKTTSRVIKIFVPFDEDFASCVVV